MGLISEVTFFQDGNVNGPAMVGVEERKNYVVRYKLTPEKDINYLKLIFGKDGYISPKLKTEQYLTAIRNYYHGGTFNFYYAISSDSEKYKNAGYKDIGKAYDKVKLKLKDNNIEFSFTCEIFSTLKAGETYYLWIFPGFCNLSASPYWAEGLLYWPTFISNDSVSFLSGLKCKTFIKRSNNASPHKPAIQNNSKKMICNPYIIIPQNLTNS